MFLLTADAKFGPITTLRKNGKVVKHIPWTAFRLDESDWARLPIIIDILRVRIFFSHFPFVNQCTIVRCCSKSALTIFFRMQTGFNNTFHQTEHQRYGESFPL